MHVPTCYQCLWYGVILKKKKKKTQNDHEVTKKKVKIFEWLVLPYGTHFPQ